MSKGGAVLDEANKTATKCLPVLQFFKTKGYRVLGPAEAEAAGISMQLTTLEKML